MVFSQQLVQKDAQQNQQQNSMQPATNYTTQPTPVEQTVPQQTPILGQATGISSPPQQTAATVSNQQHLISQLSYSVGSLMTDRPLAVFSNKSNNTGRENVIDLTGTSSTLEQTGAMSTTQSTQPQQKQQQPQTNLILESQMQTMQQPTVEPQCVPMQQPSMEQDGAVQNHQPVERQPVVQHMEEQIKEVQPMEQETSQAMQAGQMETTVSQIVQQTSVSSPSQSSKSPVSQPMEVVAEKQAVKKEVRYS